MTAVLPPSVAALRSLAEPALRDAVATLHPRLARVVGYHRGWNDIDGRPLDNPAGKALRPALALLSARAVGGAVDLGCAAAVAVELVHDFSLLHDDLMDGDTERRHQPTAWVAFGVGDATLAGDALLSLATRVVLDCGSPHTLAGVQLLHRGVARLVEGQAMDLDFETRTDVPLEECLQMAAGKTAALLSCACALGALLAGGPEPVVAGLGRFGEDLGVAFQLVDDILGIWGDPAVTGKPVLSDLRRRKKSLPVVAALTSGAPGADRLGRFLAAPPGGPPEDAELTAAAEVLEASGARTWAVQEAGRRLTAAEHELAALALPAEPAAELLAIARFTVTRSL